MRTPFQVRFADRMNQLPPYLFGMINKMKMEKRWQGDDVIDLGMGNPVDPAPDTVIGKLCEVAQRASNEGIQMHGGIGMTKDLPLERWYREMRIRRVGEGPNEVQRLIIARDLLGGNYK